MRAGLGEFGFPALSLVAMACGALWLAGALSANLAAPLRPIVDLVARLAAVSAAGLDAAGFLAMAIIG